MRGQRDSILLGAPLCANGASGHDSSMLSPDVGLGTVSPSLSHPKSMVTVLPCGDEGRAVLTQMTLLGEPMLDPGGEMEVSDVLLCCGVRRARAGESPGRAQPRQGSGGSEQCLCWG